jgi:hypothetical protein
VVEHSTLWFIPLLTQDVVAKEKIHEALQPASSVASSLLGRFVIYA